MVTWIGLIKCLPWWGGEGAQREETFSIINLSALSFVFSPGTVQLRQQPVFDQSTPPPPHPSKKNIIYNRPRQWRTRPRFFTVQNRAWNFKIHRSTGPQLFEERLYIERVFWKEPLEWCWGGAEKWIPGLYVAGQIREINVLASIAASLQPHFLGPVASMSRGWKGTLLKFGGEVGEGRVQPEDTFSVPLGSFQSGCPTSPNRWPGSRSVREPSGSVFAENTLDQSSNRRKEKSPNSRALRADTDRDVW